MTHIGLEHSDYIVYVDESGDHSLNSIIGFCVSCLMLAFITWSAPAMAANGVYIGTYTSPPYGNGEGIYYFLLDNGVVTSPLTLANRTISPAINPSYLLTMQDQGSLYAVDEFFQINGPLASSGVTAYAINNGNKQLTTLNTQLTGLAAPVYLLADDTKKNLVIANYGDGSPNPTSGITVMPIQSDHSVAPYRQLIIHPSSPTVSHTHGLAKKTLGGVEYIFATDLGTSTLYAYTFDNTLPEPLQPFASANGNPGQGLRHVVVSQDGKYLYVANEFDPAFPLTSSVSVYSFNPQVIPHLSLLTSLPAEHIQPGDLTANFPSELALNGNRLYVSNRGGNNIAEFNVINDGANLSFVDQFSVEHALRPREFAITPNGQYLVAAYQDSKNVIVFKIEENGALTYITTVQPIHTPVAVAFITLISTSGLSGNALTVANYLNSLGPSFDNLSPIFDSLDLLSTSELIKALNRINPARNTFTTFTSQNTQFEFSSLVSSRLSDQRMFRFSHPSKQAYATSANSWDEETLVADASERLILQKKKPAEKYTFWIGGIGQFGYERAQQQNPSFHLNSGGALVAFDYLGFDNALIGGGIGYAHNSIHEAQNAGEGSIDIYVATFYGIAYLSSFYFEGALFGAYDQFKNERHIFSPGYDQTAKSHHQGYQLTPHVGLGYDINSQRAVFEPFLAFDWAINFEEGYKEHGATSLNMNIRHRNSSMLRSEAGLNVYQNLNFSWGIIAFREKISYVNKKLFGVGRLTAAVVGAPVFFTVEALGPTQNLVSPAFEFFARGANGWFGSLSYDGEFGSRYLSNTIFGKLGKYF